MTILLIGTRSHHHQISENAVGDIGFGTVEQPVVTLVLGTRLHSGQITSGIRFSHGDGKDGFAADRTRQVSVLLCGCRELVQVRADQHRVSALKKTNITVTHVLFDQHLLKTQISQAQPAVLLFSPHQ
ncbi:hypothetical protein D3C84_378050 [compost metagenome]